MLNVGDEAPEIVLPDQKGETVTLSALRDKPVVLYFYPKADTPGCTKEACDFRDNLPRFDTAEATVLGISPDTVEDQAKFAAKFDLPFRLLADADHAIAETYGVWGEKNLYGRKFMGADRATFVIDKNGRIAQIFRKVKVDGHADAVLTALREIKGE